MSRLRSSLGAQEFEWDSDDGLEIPFSNQNQVPQEPPPPSPDDDLLQPPSSIDLVKLYAKSKLVIHRLYLVRDLIDYANSLPFDDAVQHILPLLETLARDKEAPIRQGVAEQLPELSLFLTKKLPVGYECIMTYCLPVLTDLLQDDSAQVRESSVAALLEIAQLFSPEDLQKYLLPIIDTMATDCNDEDCRVQSAQILNELSPKFGEKLTIDYALPLLASLTNDATFRVRKAVASSFNLICDCVGVRGTTELVLPLYLKLTKDEIWGVRKACADSLVALSKNIDRSTQAKVLVPLFDEMAHDKSRWVRSAACEALGPFIATFPKNMVPVSLLDHFTYFGNPDMDSGDSEHTTVTAFNFPAVLLTAGAERWPKLRDTWLALTKDQQWKVRRTLAFSLHVVSEILGQKIAEESLVPIFDLFLKDLDEVKIGVIKNFYKFLQVLTPETRKQYFKILEDVQNNTKNWRFRRLIARQLGNLATLFNTQTDQLLTLTMNLINDPVARVRQGLHSQVALVITSLQGTPEKQEDLLEKIRNLAKHNNHQMRLMFTKLAACSVAHLNKDTFESVFFAPLITLSKDKVPNVKMFAGLALKDIAQNDSYKGDSRIMVVLQALQSDKDKDTVILAGGTPSTACTSNTSDVPLATCSVTSISVSSIIISTSDNITTVIKSSICPCTPDDSTSTTTDTTSTTSGSFNTNKPMTNTV